jgi:hypothetical protein
MTKMPKTYAYPVDHITARCSSLAATEYTRKYNQAVHKQLALTFTTNSSVKITGYFIRIEKLPLILKLNHKSDVTLTRKLGKNS